MTACIYGLVDPRDNRVFYIGQTRNKPQIRLTQHISVARNNPTKNKDFKILEIINDEKKPIVIVLEWIYELSQINKREKFWIDRYKKIVNLLNQVDPTSKNACEIVLRGEKVHFYKLIEKDVLEIIDLYKNTSYSVREIAKIYNVTSGAIGAITRGKNWKHLTNGKLRSDYVNEKLKRPNGEFCRMSILKSDQVLKIREMCKTIKTEEIAKQFGVSQSAIEHIKSNRSWRHL